MRHFRAILSARLNALILLIAMTLAIRPAHAAFQEQDWGARPVGMGGAFTAIADDSNAALYNPAGLVQVQRDEVSAMYADLFTGQTLYAGNDTVHLSESYLAYASHPIEHVGSFGFSWTNFNTTNLYREDSVIVSYARSVGDFVPSLGDQLSVGVNLKYLHVGYSLDPNSASDPVFQGGSSANGVSGDVGLLYKPSDNFLAGWRFGLTAQNVNEPNLGIQSTDRVPMTWRAGVAYQNRLLPWLIPAIDLTRRDGVNEAHAGIESWLFNDALGLRAGVNRDEGALGISYYQLITKRLGFRLDYGVTIPYYVQGTTGNHRLSITAYF